MIKYVIYYRTAAAWETSNPLEADAAVSIDTQHSTHYSAHMLNVPPEYAASKHASRLISTAIISILATTE